MHPYYTISNFTTFLYVLVFALYSILEMLRTWEFAIEYDGYNSYL